MKVGDKVICINSAMQPHTAEELSKDVKNWIRKGQTYTIREIADFDFVVGLLLEEVVNTPKYFKAIDRVIEPTFAIWRFKKCKEDEVAIEKLEDVLVKEDTEW